MTARATAPLSVERSRKREDTTPKQKTRNGVRGANPQATIHEARSRGISTSNNAGAMLVSPDKPLTEKQKLFVEHWAKGDSIPAAAVRAGYADGGQMAYRMVRMPNILKLKAEYEAKYEAEAQMSRKKVMDGFLEAIDMAKLMAEPATMISGWTAVAKMCGYMAPIEHKMKVDVTGNVTMQKLTAMSDAELLEMIERGPRNDSTQLLTDQTDGRAAL
jgi:phage terminase small subunit